MLDDNFEPGFRAKLHLKDARIVHRTAIQLGLELPALEVMTERLNALVDSDRGDLDHSALVLLARGQ